MLVIIVGILFGISLGLTGGGSILSIPILVYFFSIKFSNAVIISLMAVFINSFIGILTKLKRNEIYIKVGVLWLITSIAIIPFGAYISKYVNSNILLYILSSLMIFIGISYILKVTILAGKKQSDNITNFIKTRNISIFKYRLIIVTLSLFTGFLTGVFGIGGGFFIVPAMVFILKVPIKKAVDTCLFIVCLSSLVGLITHINHHSNINVYITVFFIIGSIIGMITAIKVKKQVNDNIMQIIISIILISLGIFSTVKTLMINS